MKTARTVCVFSERRDVALELLAAGRTLSGTRTLVSVASGVDGEATAREQIARGADVAFVAESRETCDPGELQIEALHRVVAQLEPEVLLIGATAHGTEIASRLAQRQGVGCASECTRLDDRDGKLVVERTCLGRFVSREVIETRPAIATVPARRFEPPERDPHHNGELQKLEIVLPAFRSPIIATRDREKSSVRIDKADVVVAVGRGLKSEEDLRLVDALAQTLGGVVGASRPLTDDLQWLSPDRKVGLSGVTVRPRLYIACGISGQIEHNVGMRESAVVVAINNDPAAPIMQQADYCITGDLYEVVPALIAAVREIGNH